MKIKGAPIPDIDPTKCEQSGVSMCTTVEEARNKFNSALNKKERWQSIGEVTIPTRAGKLGRCVKRGHQTWWPSRECDPVVNCKVLT